MQRDLSEQKCPACGAPLRFDPASGKSVCDWCGKSYEIPSTAEEPAEGEAQAEGGSAPKPGISEEICVYSCRSCGAEIVTDAVTASVTCPYCGNNIILTEKVTGGLRPDGIIPFKIDKKDLPAAVQNFYKDKMLLPKRFFSESSIRDLCGVYVPFWLYDCTMSGSAYYEGYNDSAMRSGDYIITERKHYDLERGVNMDFKDIPVDGSARLDDALMDSLEPFDMADMKPFRMSYLSGFFAERFDKDSDEVRQRAEDRMLTSTMRIVNASAGDGYMGVVPKDNDIKPSNLNAKYVLLPVYTFKVNYKGTDYSFAMNGQTGEVVGDVPTDKGRALTRRWGTFAAVFAAIMLIIWFISC
ncbi:MAG: hypothetical protein K6G56_06835 [Clostridiales bacterium]|nr:hypothetical protein [Clostridiales bacterium]